MAQRTFPIVVGFVIVGCLFVLLSKHQHDLIAEGEKNSPAAMDPVADSVVGTLNARESIGSVPPSVGTLDPPSNDRDSKAAEIRAQFHIPKLTADEGELFVSQNQRSAASLVAAFRTSGEAKFLAEAMRDFPKDAHVAFEALFHVDLPPEERAGWINALKHAAPDNALANYLAAQEYFKAGQTELAMSELQEAFGKPVFNDMTLERMQFNEEAYRANGHSELASRSTAMFQLPLPLLKEMQSLAEQTIELSKSYRQAGQAESADLAVEIAMSLGEQYRNSGEALLVHQLLGMEIEETALKSLRPDVVLAPSGKSSQHLLEELKADRAALVALVRETVPFQDQMTSKDWIGYIDRMKYLGEPNAMRWLKTKFNPQ